MTTYAATIASVRRLLKDNPLRVDLAAAITDTTTATFTVAAGDIGKFTTGQRWEHDDGDETGAEQRYVTAVDDSTNTVTADRGAFNSTADTHVDASYILLAPKYPYDEAKQVIDTLLDAVLYPKGLYNIVERTITSSASTETYEIPASTVQEVLTIYQRPVSTDPPIYIRGFTPYPHNVDTSITGWTSGKVITIWENAGVDGDTYYLNCKERHTISTLTTPLERIVQYLTAAELIMWEDARRLAVDTKQGDRSITPGSNLRLAEAFRQQADELIKGELSNLRNETPVGRRFRYTA